MLSLKFTMMKRAKASEIRHYLQNIYKEKDELRNNLSGANNDVIFEGVIVYNVYQ